MKLVLTPKEEQIMGVLKEVLRINKLEEKVEVRVAGGWVRDRLLGLQSSDIDIAIDALSGKEFAQLVVAYLKEQGDPDAHHFGVVEKNSDKSKHLETTILKIKGYFIDCCQLRNETYASDSRIP